MKPTANKSTTRWLGAQWERGNVWFTLFAGTMDGLSITNQRWRCIEFDWCWLWSVVRDADRWTLNLWWKTSYSYTEDTISFHQRQSYVNGYVSPIFLRELLFYVKLRYFTLFCFTLFCFTLFSSICHIPISKNFTSSHYGKELVCFSFKNQGVEEDEDDFFCLFCLFHDCPFPFLINSARKRNKNSPATQFFFVPIKLIKRKRKTMASKELSRNKLSSRRHNTDKVKPSNKTKGNKTTTMSKDKINRTITIFFKNKGNRKAVCVWLSVWERFFLVFFSSSFSFCSIQTK